MHDRHRRGRTESERYPSRRLSSIGGRTTGWRSSLETNPHESFRSFLAGLLIAAAVFVLIVLAIMFFGSADSVR